MEEAVMEEAVMEEAVMEEVIMEEAVMEEVEEEEAVCLIFLEVAEILMEEEIREPTTWIGEIILYLYIFNNFSVNIFLI